MKTVIIPSDCGDPFVVMVNNKIYKYEPGAEVSVPDEVAVIIDNYWKLQPLPLKPVDGGVFPYVSGKDDGKVLKVKDGAWQPGDDEGGGASFFDVAVTVESSPWSATTDKTYAEIAAAVSAGKQLHFAVEIDGSIAHIYNYENKTDSYAVWTIKGINGSLMYIAVTISSSGALVTATAIK